VNGASISGSSTGVPNNYIVGINYNNAKACIYSEDQFSLNRPAWTFPGSLNIENDVRDLPAGTPATSYNAGSSPIIVYTTTPNADIQSDCQWSQYAAYLEDNTGCASVTDSEDLKLCYLSEWVGYLECFTLGY
jgi:hypothetical protein